jgi:uncharacterized protein (DUF58 family)
MAMNGEELFDARFLERLRTLFFKLRRRRQMKVKGGQASTAAGFSREFKDHRAYTPGDDFRTVDWRLYARLQKMFIRVFEAVQELHVHVLLDRSRSMVEPYPAKRTTALRLAVALAYLALVNEHRVSLMSISGSPQRELPPLKGQGHIHEILDHVSAIEFEGQTDLVGCLRQLRPGRDRKGIAFIVSDLFGRSPGEAEEALAQVAAWPAETHVIHVLEPREAAPELDGELRLVDVESGEVRRMWLTKRERALYRRRFAEYQEELRLSCMRRQIDYVTWSTDQHFEEMFLHLLSRGSALAEA